jgi:hypothetical protein
LHRGVVRLHYDIVRLHRDVVRLHYGIVSLHRDVVGLHYDIEKQRNNGERPKSEFFGLKTGISTVAPW